MTLPAISVSQTPEEKFGEYLASRPEKQCYTAQQRELVKYIFAQHNHFDADQLLAGLKQAGVEISRATVYRTLAKLVEAGLLRKLEIGPRMCYEHDYGYPQHEHLRCCECQSMIEFQSPALDAVLREVAREHRFNVSGHTLLVRGVCSDCTRAKTSRRVLDLI